jgi:hypothetical protein
VVEARTAIWGHLEHALRSTTPNNWCQYLSKLQEHWTGPRHCVTGMGETSGAHHVMPRVLVALLCRDVHSRQHLPGEPLHLMVQAYGDV